MSVITATRRTLLRGFGCGCAATTLAPGFVARAFAAEVVGARYHRHDGAVDFFDA